MIVHKCLLMSEKSDKFDLLEVCFLISPGAKESTNGQFMDLVCMIGGHANGVEFNGTAPNHQFVF